MVKAAVTNVIGPAIAADDPYIALDQRVSQYRQLTRITVVRAEPQEIFEQLYALTLLADDRFIRLISLAQLGCQFRPNRISETLYQIMRILSTLVLRKANAQTELGIIFKQGVGPGSPATVIVECVRGRRQIAPVNRGTPSGISYDGAVAKELGHQLDVWSFTAAGASAGKLK